MKKIRLLFIVACLACLGVFSGLLTAHATPYQAPERIKAVMIGDRLVDVAVSLGVLPEGMSVRASIWPQAHGYKYSAQLLGCPKCIVSRVPEAVPSFLRERGITRVIIEKSSKFCLYMKNVDPRNVIPLIKDMPGVTIEYVDFTQGVVPAIEQAARLLGKEERGKAVVAAYQAAMKRVEASLPKAALGRKVLVLNGKYMAATGKAFVRIEAPGGYTDQYILAPLGCVNAAAPMITGTMTVTKGHVPAGRLQGLDQAAPDVIVATGDAFAVQKALRDAVKKNPALARIPAIADNEIYALPLYCDSGVLEYPEVFGEWQQALTP